LRAESLGQVPHNLRLLRLVERLSAELAAEIDVLPETGKAPRRDHDPEHGDRGDEEQPCGPGESLRQRFLVRVELRPKRDEAGHLAGNHSCRRVLEASDAELEKMQELPPDANARVGIVAGAQ
jgi:hypothetical protein